MVTKEDAPICILISPSRCLTDSQLPGSRSGFMRRTQDNKLGFHIDAFRFYQEDRAEVRAVFNKNNVVEAIMGTVVKLFYSNIIYRHYVGYCDSASLFCLSCFSQLYITCHLMAVPVMDHAEPSNKACSFIDGRWDKSHFLSYWAVTYSLE